MKNLYAILLLTIIANPLFSQTRTGWYKTFTGKIGNMDAVLHLVAATNYSGYLWFKQNQYPIGMISDAIDADSIQLYSTDGTLSVTLTGIITHHAIRGIGTIDLATDNQPGKKADFNLRADSSFSTFLEFYSRTDSKLPEKFKNESTFSYFKGTIWPQGNSQLSKNIQRIILHDFHLKNNGDIIGQIKIQGQLESKKWIAENSKMTPSEVSEMGLSLSVETQDYFNIMYEDKRFITLSRFNFEYTGGAHGNYGTTLYTFTKKDGRLLNLNDILTDKGIKILPELLEAVAKIQFKVKQGALKENGFLVDHIPVSKEFYVTGKGIGFLYNPYEIMPFSAGQVNLLVPFTALYKYLKPEFSL